MRLTADRLLALGLLAVAVFFGWETAALPEPVAFQQVSAKAWPTVVVTAAILTCALLWIGGGEAPPAPPAGPEEDETPAGRPGWIMLLGLVLSIPVMIYLGYWIACTALMLLSAWLKDPPRRLLRNATVAVAFPGATYLLFTRFFEQFLPVGKLFD